MAKDDKPLRIVVALDDSPHARAALEAAAEMAERMHAELVAIYVEDVDLLHTAGLPFAVEYSHYATTGRALDALAMQRRLRMQAERLRRAVGAAASRHHVRWQFRSARGRVPIELLQAAEDAEMLILGKASGARTRRMRLGTTARLVVTQARRTVVILQHGAKLARPVLVPYDGTEAGARALNLAAQLARSDHGHVVVLLPRADADTVAKLETQVKELLARANASVRFVAPVSPDLSGLRGAVEREGCRTLVLDAESRFLAGAPLTELLSEIDCPVVLVR